VWDEFPDCESTRRPLRERLSTRFTDGYEFGRERNIGKSTQKTTVVTFSNEEVLPPLPLTVATLPFFIFFASVSYSVPALVMIEYTDLRIDRIGEGIMERTTEGERPGKSN